MEVTMPVPYDPSSPNNFPGGTYFYNPGYSDWKQVTNSKKILAKQTSLRYVFTDKSGADTEVFLYKDGKYKYLELPGKGVWREEDGANGFLSEMKSYRSLQFKVVGYDLMTGEEKTVEDDVNQFHGEKIKEYLAGMD